MDVIIKKLQNGFQCILLFRSYIFVSSFINTLNTLYGLWFLLQRSVWPSYSSQVGFKRVLWGCRASSRTSESRPLCEKTWHSLTEIFLLESPVNISRNEISGFSSKQATGRSLGKVASTPMLTMSSTSTLPMSSWRHRHQKVQLRSWSRATTTTTPTPPAIVKANLHPSPEFSGPK